MEDILENKPAKYKKHICMGIVAHVDAGKTTLSEELLYLCGELRTPGRVDKGDAFLDTYELEKSRGITIFSKQALLHYKDMEITLLDTPGHVDFSAEMERTLQVLDYAILVVSGADGVQGHTRTLWDLLKRYNVPVFLFLNKMDQPGTDKEALLAECQKKLGEGIVDFSGGTGERFFENIALCEEELLEGFLEKGKIENDDIVRLIAERKLFPCFFGSALYGNGVEELIKGIEKYTGAIHYDTEGAFGARIFKISRDRQGNRLTFLKVTGGSLSVRQELRGRLSGGEEGNWQEKITQIRRYNGAKYDVVETARAGEIYAVTGLSYTEAGEGLGAEKASAAPLLMPVLTYQVLLPEGMLSAVLLQKLRILEEEEPELHIVWDERLQEIRVQIMGQVQLEVLKSLMEERFQIAIGFGPGSVVYKETIADKAKGTGHFEPLRHYAEVQLLLEPGERGSGVQIENECGADMLDRNWQRLILSHLEEKEHKGVLIGAPLTDIKITLLGGRAHIKHTEGGDFRQAAWRAVRQGLMQAESVLLEPWYDFTLEVPEQAVGRAMTDMERFYGKISPPEWKENLAVLRGRAPAACLQDYQTEVTAYTRGQGHLICTPGGYAPCHNAEEVIERSGYEPEADLENPSSSIFCAHGAGFVVPWYEVPDYMHLESMGKDRLLTDEDDISALPGTAAEAAKRAAESRKEKAIGTEEIDAIIERISHANSRDKAGSRKWNSYRKKEEWQAEETRTIRYDKPQEEYLLVDGYNIIFAWEELKSLSELNIDGARGRLLDILCNYQGMRKCEVIVVFDAYRVKGHDTEVFRYHNISVVYTKQAETADSYIERFSHENSKKYRITVATSDGLEQIIIRGEGCRLLSARDLKKEIDYYSQMLREEHLQKQSGGKRYVLDELTPEVRKQIENQESG